MAYLHTNSAGILTNKAANEWDVQMVFLNPEPASEIIWFEEYGTMSLDNSVWSVLPSFHYMFALRTELSNLMTDWH